jgi:hypothetical protein
VGPGCAGVLSVQLLRLDGDVGARGPRGYRLSDSEPTQDEREEAAKLLNRDDMPPPTADEVDDLVEALKRMRGGR